MTVHAYFFEIVQIVQLGYIITGAQWQPKVLHIEMHQNPLDIIYLARRLVGQSTRYPPIPPAKKILMSCKEMQLSALKRAAFDSQLPHKQILVFCECCTSNACQAF